MAKTLVGHINGFLQAPAARLWKTRWATNVNPFIPQCQLDREPKHGLGLGRSENHSWKYGKSIAQIPRQLAAMFYSALLS